MRRLAGIAEKNELISPDRGLDGGKGQRVPQFTGQICDGREKLVLVPFCIEVSPPIPGAIQSALAQDPILKSRAHARRREIDR
jgi:hypothetical protein